MASWASYSGSDPYMRRWALIQRWKTRGLYLAIFGAFGVSGYAIGLAARILLP